MRKQSDKEAKRRPQIAVAAAAADVTDGSISSALLARENVQYEYPQRRC
jgi:hypothetical protein